MHSLFVEAAAGVSTVSWTGASHVHVMRVCPQVEASVEAGLGARLEETDATTRLPSTAFGPGKTRREDESNAESDFGPLVDETIRRATVSELSGEAGTATQRRADGDRFGRWVGILVHRLLQREEFIAEQSDDMLRETARGMLDSAVLAELGDPAAIIEGAVTSFRQISSRADVRGLYRTGRPYHELPFAMAIDGRIVRGTIDCLVASSDTVTVLEFKTGRPRPEHQAQAEVYRAAAQALFPAAAVESRLVYTSEPMA
jgi:hypothetical protein